MSEVVLHAQGLTKRFGKLVAVDDLNLDVYRGEVFGLLGPNGAGKTTSINMICGLLEPDQGKVIIQGLPRRTDAYARVGMCPQETILWEKLTPLDQLEFIGEMYNLSRRDARQRGEELLDLLGLFEKRNTLASTLSGGMKRRLNLALALVHDPEIIVLDEPEAGLDPQSRVLVREYIRSLADKKTILLTTHNMDEAERMADRVAIIDHGKLLVVDTPHALKRTVGLGDVLEIEILGITTSKALTAIKNALPKLTLPTPKGAESISFAEDSRAIHNNVVARGNNIAAKLPTIINSIQSIGGQVGEIHLRANTLEDVFIALTGRRLRE